MTIYALDPGPIRSALVCLVDGAITQAVMHHNDEMLLWLEHEAAVLSPHSAVLVIEQVRSYGMAVGAEVFETVRWSGRFEQMWDWSTGPVVYVPRLTVKTTLCHDSRAKDTNIRQAVMDLYGGKAATKKGGPLAAIRKDLWSALALALTYQQQQKASAA